jgi:4'-phosphopantetheinyl transferase
MARPSNDKRIYGAGSNPAQELNVGPSEVQIWQLEVSLSRSASDEEDRRHAQRQTARDAPSFTAWLDPAERARASCFQFEHHRRRFAEARGLLRTLLGRELGLSPAHVRFETNAFGKPRLASDVCHAASHLRFNVSHSHEMVLIALAWDREVGIDVEHVRPMPDALELAARYFAPAEQHALERAAPAQRDHVFFAIWTRKEAFIKACGEGLSRSVNWFEVGAGPGPEIALTLLDNPGESSRWQLRHLDVATGYQGALAVGGDGAIVERRVWRQNPR